MPRAYLTDPMRRYLAALWLRQHGVCVSMREWASPRWAGMRKGLIARGLVRREDDGSGAYVLTSSGEQIATRLGACAVCAGKGWCPASEGAWAVPCTACAGAGIGGEPRA